jgi:nitrate/TMAO reductase-like tetraheme cytochrome c subunit
MLSKITVICLVFTLTFSFLLFAQAKEPQYIGSKKCKTCHNSAKNGAQFKLWSTKKHAKAYESLSAETAQKKAEAMGVKDPLTSEKCLSCHSPLFVKKNKAATVVVGESVGCEACHGAGSDYKKLSTMKDRKLSMAAGLLLPDEKTCLNCHKKDTPGHEVSFTTFEKEYAKIAHPVPPENDRRKK